METISYKVLRDMGYTGYLLEDGPVKVLQFGEGNFLRAFVDYFIDCANEKAGWNGKVTVVQPIQQGLAAVMNKQECLYTLYLRGREKGEKVDYRRVISACKNALNPYEADDYQKMMDTARSEDLEIIVSNTTEAGIAYDENCKADDQPPASFPAKLTQVLYQRYQAFAGAPDKGVVILACELIDNNGQELLRCVNRYIEQWDLGADFYRWVNEHNIFCSTLVDRIVSGRVRDPEEYGAMERANGYHDDLLDVGEIFGVWVIEGPDSLTDKLPFAKAGLPVQVVDDVTPYKKRKVRILNGAHTGFVLGAYLAGENIVRDCMHDEAIKGFMTKMLYDEIVPLLPLPKEELLEFTASVEDRFDNPFVNHELLSISLNSTSKWRARNLPSLKAYVEAKHALPSCLTMSLAAYIAFYSCDLGELTDKGLWARRPNGDAYCIQDDRWVLEFYDAHRADRPEELVHAVLGNAEMWGEDLTEIGGLEEKVSENLRLIRSAGCRAAYASCLK